MLQLRFGDEIDFADPSVQKFDLIEMANRFFITKDCRPLH